MIGETIPSPSALKFSVQTITELHPFSVSGGWNASSSRLIEDAQRLWATLASYSKSERRAAIVRLSVIEVRILVFTARGRFNDPECLDVLSDLLIKRDVADGVPLAFDAFLFSDGDEAFRTLALQYAMKHAQAAAFLCEVVNAQRPSVMAAYCYSRQNDPFDLWIQSPLTAIESHVRFTDEIRHRLLRSDDGIKQIEQREDPETIAAWLTSVVPLEKREATEIRFLNASYANQRRRLGRWQCWPTQHAVLSGILLRRGEPAPDSTFWQRVSREARDAFNLWIQDRTLTGLLGENDRVEFWRRYLPFIQGSEANSDRQVVFIQFEGWFAVQFVNPGTATYLLSNKVRRGLHRKDEIQLQRLVRGGTTPLGSYEHRGYRETWQANAASIVERVRRTVEVSGR